VKKIGNGNNGAFFSNEIQNWPNIVQSTNRFQIVSLKKFDVLSINETKLDDSVKDSNVYIPGYEIIRWDREINGRFGDGVCFCIRTC